MPMHAKEFAQAMAAFDPFEAKPRLAVAVSGGADSLALTLLADRWAKARGGEVLALTVDHGLRDAAAGEARQVAKWLRARQVPHRVLRWQGRKPKTGIQAAARGFLARQRCGFDRSFSQRVPPGPGIPPVPCPDSWVWPTRRIHLPRVLNPHRPGFGHAADRFPQDSA